MLRPEVYLFDGENLTFRYQDMVTQGRTPLADVLHAKDIYIWHKFLITKAGQDVVIGDLRRAIYYTSLVGDDERVRSMTKAIRSISYVCGDGRTARTAHLVAKVYKKEKQSHKSRSVDINIVVDALTSANNRSAGEVLLYSGDGDFVPLIDELMRLGITVRVRALSSGLNPRMEVAGDSFELIDHCLFQPVPKPPAT